ncbi:MAG: glycosyltransferase [Thiohalocapsa sp.]
MNTLIDTLRAHALFYEVKRQLAAEKSATSFGRQLLLLTIDFPPKVSGGVYRPAALVKYASAAGYKVSVIAASSNAPTTRAGLDLLKYIGDEPRVIMFTPPQINPSVRFFPYIDGGLVSAACMVKAAMKRLRGPIPGTIIASGPPFCSFVAGYLLARAQGRRLILDYRDEWSECPFDFVEKSREGLRWESRCLEQASLIIMTTESQKRHLGQVFGDLVSSKCVVIPNGWEPDFAPESHTLPHTEFDRVVLTFAGKLGGHTDPKRFLDALYRLLQRRPDLKDKLLVRFIGAKGHDAMHRIDAFPIQEILDIVPAISPIKAVGFIRSSQALLLFHDARFARYLPGKIYEYIASSVPILLLDDCGESDRLVRELQLGWSVNTDDDSGIETILDGFIAKQRDNVNIRTRSTTVQRWLEAHERSRLSQLFIEQLARAVGS